jgi:hypothetical protein
MLYEIRKVDYKANTNEILSTGLSADEVKYLLLEKGWLSVKNSIIGYVDESYKQTGIIEALAEYCGSCDVINVCIDPGYGYDHVLMFHLCFSDKQLGLCIFDTRTKQFIEEPGEYDEYSITADEVERKYNFKSIL